MYAYTYTHNLTKDAKPGFERDGSRNRFKLPALVNLQSVSKFECIAFRQGECSQFIEVPANPKWLSSSTRLRCKPATGFSSNWEGLCWRSRREGRGRWAAPSLLAGNWESAAGWGGCLEGQFLAGPAGPTWIPLCPTSHLHRAPQSSSPFPRPWPASPCHCGSWGVPDCLSSSVSPLFPQPFLLTCWHRIKNAFLLMNGHTHLLLHMLRPPPPSLCLLWLHLYLTCHSSPCPSARRLIHPPSKSKSHTHTHTNCPACVPAPLAASCSYCLAAFLFNSKLLWSELCSPPFPLWVLLLLPGRGKGRGVCRLAWRQTHTHSQLSCKEAQRPWQHQWQA